MSLSKIPQQNPSVKISPGKMFPDKIHTGQKSQVLTSQELKPFLGKKLPTQMIPEQNPSGHNHKAMLHIWNSSRYLMQLRCKRHFKLQVCIWLRQGWKNPGNLGTCSHAHISIACNFVLFTHTFWQFLIIFYKTIANFVKYSYLYPLKWMSFPSNFAFHAWNLAFLILSSLSTEKNGMQTQIG